MKSKAKHLGSSVWPRWRCQRPATAATGPPGCSPWTLSPAPASSWAHSEWPGLSGQSATHQWPSKMQSATSSARRDCLLASLVNVRGNLDSRVGVVDVVFEVWIVDKLQLDVRGVFHLSFSIHGILESQHKLSALNSDTTGPWVGVCFFSLSVSFFIAVVSLISSYSFLTMSWWLYLLWNLSTPQLIPLVHWCFKRRPHKGWPTKQQSFNFSSPTFYPSLKFILPRKVEQIFVNGVTSSYSHSPVLPLSRNKPCPAPFRETQIKPQVSKYISLLVENKSEILTLSDIHVFIPNYCSLICYK